MVVTVTRRYSLAGSIPMVGLSLLIGMIEATVSFPQNGIRTRIHFGELNALLQIPCQHPRTHHPCSRRCRSPWFHDGFLPDTIDSPSLGCILWVLHIQPISCGPDTSIVHRPKPPRLPAPLDSIQGPTHNISQVLECLLHPFLVLQHVLPNLLPF